MQVHTPTVDCDGIARGPKCIECNRPLCACERAYGHDCEGE